MAARCSRSTVGLNLSGSEKSQASRYLSRHSDLPTPKGREIETEAAPIRYVAELLGADADSERAIRWLILMMVLMLLDDGVDAAIRWRSR